MRVPFKVTSQSDYEGARTFTRITLNAIYSYSYRADSIIDAFILWHCAGPRKSPTIRQLLEMCLRCGDLARLLHLIIKLIDGLSSGLAEYNGDGESEV